MFNWGRLVFRDADLSDIETLWRWRNEAEVEGLRGGWYKGSLTTLSEHETWFLFRLNRVEMLVWEEAGVACGTVRIDSNGEVSFYVPKVFRASGVAVRMLKALLGRADEFGGRLKATVDEDNGFAALSLAQAGFRPFPVRFFAYKP